MEIDGREIRPLDERQVRDTVDKIVAAGIHAIAIVGIFSALDHQGLHEDRCKQIMLEAYPQLEVVVSHDIGGPGLLPRENATILNAAILSFAKRTVRGFHRAMQQLGLKCPLYLTQNDGTLIDAERAAQIPIRTFASGPTNSLVGAAFLHGQSFTAENKDKQVLVVDIGGTTTDVCALLPSGMPRKAPNFVDIAEVRTAFSMPELHSIGLGGGSRVRVTETGRVTVGPDSVGHGLTSEAMVFGGSTMTATDIMVAAKYADVGDQERVAMIPKEVIKNAIDEIQRLLERAIDKMRVSAGPVLVLLVGGGSIIFPKSINLAYVEPAHHDAANAVGAAIAKVAGEMDVIEILAGRDERDVVESVKRQALARAIEAGADEGDVSIAELTRIPLLYVNNKAARIVVKAVGSLRHASQTNHKERDYPDDGTKDFSIQQPLNAAEERKAEDATSDVFDQDAPLACRKPDASKTGLTKETSMTRPSSVIDLDEYRPDVRDNVWYISPIDVELLALGCGILGTGGGGSPYNMSLYVFNVLRKCGHGKIRVVQPSALQDDDICVFGSGYGAPSVSDERIKSGEEIPTTIEELNRLLGYHDFQGIVADEIGGGNGIVTLPTSARFDRPVIDCDFMGRAYPTIEHCTAYVYGHPVMPAAMADAKGNVSVVVRAENNTKLEAMFRTTCVELGNSVAVTGKPLSGRVIKDYAIPNTVSQAWFLGRAVLLAKRNKIDIIEAINEITPVKLLYTGKIVDVQRDVSRGYTVGQCEIAPLSIDEHSGVHQTVANESRNLIVTFQNEYLVAYHPSGDSNKNEKEVLCIVPDLISILGSNGEALDSPDLRYGLQVQVIGMPAHPLWTQDERALRVGGPEFFNLGLQWQPVGEYRNPKSVIETYTTS